MIVSSIDITAQRIARSAVVSVSLILLLHRDVAAVHAVGRVIVPPDTVNQHLTPVMVRIVPCVNNAGGETSTLEREVECCSQMIALLILVSISVCQPAFSS